MKVNEFKLLTFWWRVFLMFHLISQPMIVNVEENYPINSISPRSAVFHSLDLSAVRRVELDDRHHRLHCEIFDHFLFNHFYFERFWIFDFELKCSQLNALDDDWVFFTISKQEILLLFESFQVSNEKRWKCPLTLGKILKICVTFPFRQKRGIQKK